MYALFTTAIVSFLGGIAFMLCASHLAADRSVPYAVVASSLLPVSKPHRQPKSNPATLIMSNLDEDVVYLLKSNLFE